MDSQEIILEIDESNYDDFLNNEFAVLHFFSDNHMNCLMTLPLIEDAAHEFFHHDILFGNVNINEFEGIAEKHKVINLPTIVFFHSGEQVDRLESQIHEEILREKISALLQFC